MSPVPTFSPKKYWWIKSTEPLRTRPSQMSQCPLSQSNFINDPFSFGVRITIKKHTNVPMSPVPSTHPNNYFSPKVRITSKKSQMSQCLRSQASKRIFSTNTPSKNSSYPRPKSSNQPNAYTFSNQNTQKLSQCPKATRRRFPTDNITILSQLSPAVSINSTR